MNGGDLHVPGCAGGFWGFDRSSASPCYVAHKATGKQLFDSCYQNCCLYRTSHTTVVFFHSSFSPPFRLLTVRISIFRRSLLFLTSDPVQLIFHFLVYQRMKKMMIRWRWWVLLKMRQKWVRRMQLRVADRLSVELQLTHFLQMIFTIKQLIIYSKNCQLYSLKNNTVITWLSYYSFSYRRLID